MKKPTTQDIRRRFLEYFRKEKHAVISSAPVVPHDDPTLLFNNAGMNQFKDVFLGATTRDYTRATTCQKCIRAGGKHNDLENVGHTKRHLTLFEMLGNFSFGDYFKEDAIRFCWEVSTDIFNFAPEKLYPTVFTDDDEAFDLWTKYVPAERITRFGKSENFWAMGDVGPCGPCSELLYDRGPKYGPGETPEIDVLHGEGERFLEFWNLVFMQYNRGTDGKMVALPKPSIDTGAGIERCMSLIYDVDSVYETDVLRGIIDALSRQLKIPYDLEKAPEQAAAFRVIADHLRSLSFAIADGAQPSNLDRGYVLRKILRRAVRYGRQLADLNRPFLADLLPTLIDLMGDDYPELKKSNTRISEILTVEEETFQRTLSRGKNMLDKIIGGAQGGRDGHISGDDAFKLKDTYGFPIDEIILIAKDAGLHVDIARFEQLEQEARERSRASHKVTHQTAEENLFIDFIADKGTTEFTGYSEDKSEAKVVGIVLDGQFVDGIDAGEEGLLLLDRTPFYAEMGGQVGDTGMIQGNDTLFSVTNCQSPHLGLVAHIGKMVKGNLRIGDSVTAQIDTSRRQKVANNHTATHLLHWALAQVLGEHVKQAGSVVDDERLRFDFSHHKALTDDEIHAIEDLVNNRIRENKAVEAYSLSYDEAQKDEGIKQFFGDKYGSEVRVIDIDFSKELCDGTHTSAVGTIGYFRIAKEGSIAAGIRRIEAITGHEAENFARESKKRIENLATSLKAKPAKLEERIDKLVEENKELNQKLKSLQQAQTQSMAKNLMDKVETINDVKVLAVAAEVGAKELKTFVDAAMDRLQSGIIVVGIADNGRCQLVARVSDDVTKKGFSAKEIIDNIAPIIEGKGGGKEGSAQAGGKNPEKLNEAIEQVHTFLKEKCSS